MAFHFVCRGSRFHAGKRIDNKEEQTLLDAIYTTWIGVHGAPKRLYFDGEGGLNTERVKQTLKREGCEVKPRAPGQHPRHIDRRSAVTRASTHISEEQATREGVEISFDQLFAASTFAGNALMTIGQATPYHVVYGRQPPMLPELEMPGYPQGDSLDGRTDARVR